MKKISIPILCFLSLWFVSCDNKQEAPATPSASTSAQAGSTVQADVKDDVSQKNVVQIAIGSKDHTTLVAAVKAADLVNVLSNTGPFTVFAPTNTAFDKLPAGTVDGLLKPEKKDDLANILQYHVSLGVFKVDQFTDGQVIGQVNGDNIKISVKDGKVMLNGVATIIASIPASNGIIHVIDCVLLPPAKK
jgi:uncharacterized surface protein with fasciclin (FAS1) repeats